MPRPRDLVAYAVLLGVTLVMGVNRGTIAEPQIGVGEEQASRVVRQPLRLPAALEKFWAVRRP